MNGFEITLMAALILFLMVSGYIIIKDYQETRIEFKTINKRQDKLEGDINKFKHTPMKDDNMNLKLIRQIADHLEMKVIEEEARGIYMGETPIVGRRIEPKTDNEKRIEELQKEIEILKSLDKE